MAAEDLQVGRGALAEVPAVAGAHIGPTEEWKEVSGSASERPVSRKEALSCGHGVPEPSDTLRSHHVGKRACGRRPLERGFQHLGLVTHESPRVQ